MHAVCVFCGSRPGSDPAYAAAARSLGALLGRQGRRLVYGGGNVGLMGVLADAALSAGGEVVGVIPRSILAKEIGHPGLAELRVVESMHERKAVMADLADGFIALPGGIGTLEELFEVWTWGQLGLHGKPYGLLDVAGFFGPLLGFLDRLVGEGFLRQEHRDMLLVDTEPERLLARMAAYQPPALPKWIESPGT